MKRRSLFSLFFILFCGVPTLSLAEGNRLVLTVVRHGGEWDPYPGVWPGIVSALEGASSLQPWPERRVVDWGSPLLMESPLLILSGRGPAAVSQESLAVLRRYLSSGGFLFIDSAEADRAGPFARSLEALPERLFPGATWGEIPDDNALYRSFFLLSGEPMGRRRSASARGLWVQGRLAAVLSVNDVLGAWARATGGAPLFPCEPDGEPQREQARRFLMNVVLFAVTGTYKTDAIHQEYIKEKMFP